MSGLIKLWQCLHMLQKKQKKVRMQETGFYFLLFKFVYGHANVHMSKDSHYSGRQNYIPRRKYIPPENFLHFLKIAFFFKIRSKLAWFFMRKRNFTALLVWLFEPLTH